MGQPFNPRHLDVAAFAQAAAELSGRDLLQQYERLALDMKAPEPDLTLVWHARGERRSAPDGSVRPALHLRVDAAPPLTCQRCMEAVQTPVSVDRHFIFVPDEATAALLDEEAEDDVLVLSKDFDLHELIEDEVLLALPLVPRHDTCPDAVPHQAQSVDFDALDEGKPNPFAALAALKKSGLRH